MWDTIIYDNTLKDWSYSLLILVCALFLIKMLSLLNKNIIKKLTAKSATKIDDILFASLEKPVGMGIMLLAIWLATSRLIHEKEISDLLSKSYDALIILDVTWFFARFISALIEEDKPKADKQHPANRKRLQIDAKLYPIVKRLVLIIIWMFGAVTALHNVGVEVTTLLSTLGIGGIAFALAAQDTIKNVFGGFTIFTDKPFRLGDIIRIGSNEGEVIDIGLRSTRILNYDKRIITIPNFAVMDSSIINISSEHGRRVLMEIGLTYNTSYEKMQEAMRLLRDLPKHIPEMKDKGIVTSLTDFADSSMVITFIYFMQKGADIYETRSKVNMEILRTFNAAGLSFAFPTRTVYLEKT